MKRGRLLNQPLACVIAGMGHTDQLVVADAGLPIPRGPQRIDLAIEKGFPRFIRTLEVIVEELLVERIVLAQEIQSKNAEILGQIKDICHNLPIQFIPHKQFKLQSVKAKAIIRTGECTPYANVILISAVAF